MTTSAGFYLGSRTPLRIIALINTVLGTLLVASGTATLNQWMERVWDGRMRRTAKRPIPAGRVSAREALVFGGLLSVGGGLYLVLTVNALSSLLAVFTLLSYLFIYTPLKRKTPLCTLIGAIPGAMPSLIGWTGATDRIDAQAWFLFAVLFLWQFPHFLAIALMYREDYARAGYHMLPQFDQNSGFTRAEIVGFTVVLVATTMLPAITRGAPACFAVMALAGVFLLHHVVKVARSASPVLASRLLHASVLYLPVVLGTLVAFKS